MKQTPDFCLCGPHVGECKNYFYNFTLSLSCEFVRKKTNISNLSNSFEFKRASHRGLDPDPTPDHLIIKQK